jgi:outer membrane protein assembly factor BamB
MNFVAIIPSLGALGPLGLLALIAPAAFAALMLWMRRWKAALGAASAMSTVWLLQGWWQNRSYVGWWNSRAALWLLLGIIVTGFCVWAYRRRAVNRFEWRLLASVVVGCAGISFYEVIRAHDSTELRVDWMFEADRSGAFLNSPFVTDDRIYLGADLHEGFRRFGAVYAVASSGQAHWLWESDSDPRPIYSTPLMHENRLYVGEGLHSDVGCRLRCLAVVGHSPSEQWAFETQSHIESNPVLSGNRVYFGAGDDGLYCVETLTGKKVWHLENLHIDATPLVKNGIVYVGSYRADDNQHKELRLLALDAATGRVIWSEPIDLSSYSQPAIADKTVYFCLGTGNLESSGPKSAGAVVAINAATGKQIWRVDLPDSVFGSPAVDHGLVVVSCHDGDVYAFNDTDGSFRWQFHLGDPIIAAPIFDYNYAGTSLVAVNKSGRCVRLRLDGKLRNEVDLPRAAGATSGVFLAAPVFRFQYQVGHRLFVSGAVTRGIRDTPVLFCIVDDN